jgi:hypothetical protein
MSNVRPSVRFRPEGGMIQDDGDVQHLRFFGVGTASYRAERVCLGVLPVQRLNAW